MLFDRECLLYTVMYNSGYCGLLPKLNVRTRPLPVGYDVELPRDPLCADMLCLVSQPTVRQLSPQSSWPYRNGRSWWIPCKGGLRGAELRIALVTEENGFLCYTGSLVGETVTDSNLTCLTVT